MECQDREPCKSCDKRAACEVLLHASANALGCANQIPDPRALHILSATCPEVRGLARENVRTIRGLVSAITSQLATSNGLCAPNQTGHHNFEYDSSEDISSDELDETSSALLVSSLFKSIVDSVDVALDSANVALDKALGISDAPSGGLSVSTASGKKGAAAVKDRNPQLCALLEEIPKPQLKFPDYPFDNSEAPFRPQAETHSDGDAEVEQHISCLLRNNNAIGSNSEHSVAKHPLEREITAAAAVMAKRPYLPGNVTLYRPWEEENCQFIDEEEGLFEAAQELQRHCEVAVDLEHHAARSFQGFTCLIQISSRTKDYIIDAIALRGSIRRALTPLFTNPNIVKVFHGADSDVGWLERDFSIYVVNMFDTHQASRLLSYPSKSLAYLLRRFVDLDTRNKKAFQLADWRKRPLPQDMLQYARTDTHYLLYIFDRIRAELTEKSILADAWAKASSVARIRYQKPRFDPGMPQHLAAKHGLGLNQAKMRVLTELYRWRDIVAREEDESVPFVMSNRIMFKIAQSSETARVLSNLRQLLHGDDISSVLRDRLKSVAELVGDTLDAKVRDPPAAKPPSTPPFFSTSTKRTAVRNPILPSPAPATGAEAVVKPCPKVLVLPASVPKTRPCAPRLNVRKKSALLGMNTSGESSSDKELLSDPAVDKKEDGARCSPSGSIPASDLKPLMLKKGCVPKKPEVQFPRNACEALAHAAVEGQPQVAKELSCVGEESAICKEQKFVFSDEESDVDVLEGKIQPSIVTIDTSSKKKSVCYPLSDGAGHRDMLCTAAKPVKPALPTQTEVSSVACRLKRSSAMMSDSDSEDGKLDCAEQTAEIQDLSVSHIAGAVPSSVVSSVYDSFVGLVVPAGTGATAADVPKALGDGPQRLTSADASCVATVESSRSKLSKVEDGEEEAVSVLERYGGGSGKQYSQRKRREHATEAQGSSGCASPEKRDGLLTATRAYRTKLFDYEAARKSFIARERIAEVRAYSPLSDLKETKKRGHSGRMKGPRKHPKSGERSMSFKPSVRHD